MSRIVADRVTLFVYRLRERGPEHLLFLKRGRLGGRWTALEGQIGQGETAAEAAQRLLKTRAGLRAARLYFLPAAAPLYDAPSDTLSLVPAFLAEVRADAQPDLAPEYENARWVPAAQALESLEEAHHRAGLEAAQREVVQAGPGARRLEVEVRQDYRLPDW